MYAALDCNPDTGELVWLRSSPRVLEGSRAGSKASNGHIVVGFQKRYYPAARVAWFFHHGDWPEHPIGFRDGNPENLAKANLVPRPVLYSRTTKAAKMRRYRERLREREAEQGRKSALPYVTLSADKVTWFARAERDTRIVLGMFRDLGTAEAFATAAAEGYRFVRDNPVYDLEDDQAERTAGAGNGVLTLQQAHDYFAYDQTTGRFYHRHPAQREGVPATQQAPNGRPFLRAAGRQYGAGMLAWFMAHGHWPARRQVGYRDGDMTNTALANLFLKE